MKRTSDRSTSTPFDPDHPDADRIAAWREPLRGAISVERCRSLWRRGYRELALELMRLRGDL